MRANSRSTIAAAVLVCLCASGAGAVWSYDPLENNAVCTALGGQLYAEMVGDGVGGAIVVWEDDSGGDLDLYAQRLDAWGDAKWSPGGVLVCGAGGDQHVAQLASDGAGGVVVVWQDHRGSDYDIYVQRIDGFGGTPWGSAVEVCAETDDQDSAVLVGDGSGGAIVAWEDHRSEFGGGDVYAQRVDAAGALAWSAPVVIAADDVGTRHSVRIAHDGAGGAVLTWVDESVFAARIDASGSEVWADSVQVTSGTGDCPAILGDGYGGAIIVCEDTSTAGDANIVGQRLGSLGEPLWGSGGVSICDLVGDQVRPRLVGDGSGGAIVAWSDASGNIYAQRVSNLGSLLWLGSGTAVSVGGANTGGARLAEDGAGGAVVVWHGGLPGYEDVYAQRFDGSGMYQWTFNGEVVTSANGYQGEPAATGDGAGGVIVAWHDFRTGVDADIYAQRMERNGFLGYPAPLITSVIDHPDDQGGQIIVSWEPSHLDVWPLDDIDNYSIWRLYREDDARCAPSSDPLWQADVRDPDALARYGWSMVGQIGAYQLPEYAFVVPSFGDSSDAGVVITHVMILAHSYMLDDCWASEADTGYSIDNWAPGPPDPLCATVLGSDVELTWSPSGYRDEDLSHYEVHRSATSGFPPEAETLIGATSDTSLLDVNPGGGVWFYRVVAEDVHGNESVPSGEVSVDIVGTGAGEPELSTVATIRGNLPNPFNPATDITIDLPAGANVRLSVYRPDGRCVATLVDAVVGSGRHVVAWSGRDDYGREVPSGVYFVRLEAGEETAVHKMVLLK